MSDRKIGAACFYKGKEYGYEGEIRIKLDKEKVLAEMAPGNNRQWVTFEMYYDAKADKMYGRFPDEFEDRFARSKEKNE